MAPLKERLYRIIFESDTPAGRIFDIVLLAVIVMSVFVVAITSVAPLRDRYGGYLWTVEWIFTILFTIEYVLRLYSSPSPGRYARSFFGVVDLLAIMPSYLGLFLDEAHYLMVVRALRLMRVFRIFKLARYLKEADILLGALRSALPKITVFLVGVITAVVVFGTLMYLVEGEENGFANIPVSIYWAIVTLTTVGYGDISPKTPLGQFFSCIVMILGYGIIAVPTGIVSVELQQQTFGGRRVCGNCKTRNHPATAAFCSDCGSKFEQVGA